MPDLGELFQVARKEGSLLVLFIPSADREGVSLDRDCYEYEFPLEGG